jgi:hypothetical protein
MHKMHPVNGRVIGSVQHGFTSLILFFGYSVIVIHCWLFKPNETLAVGRRTNIYNFSISSFVNPVDLVITLISIPSNFRDLAISNLPSDLPSSKAVSFA